MVAKIFTLILIYFTVINYSLCFGYICESLPQSVQLENGREIGIVSQPSSCFQEYTVIAQNNDPNKNIKIRFTIVPTNFEIQIYDGKIRGGPRLQNCYIQNDSVCYSSGNTVTFYFVSLINNVGLNNRVELSVIPDTNITNNGSSIASFSFFIFFFYIFYYQTFF